MQLKSIPLADLSVNSANDRHGELADEQAAIGWLLTHRAAHMRNLTKDIVAEGRIYEPPLAHEDGGKYVVYDGNRRITSLKLLAEPGRAPSKEWADFFAAMRSQWKGQFPDRVQCHVEPDRDTLDEILYRRHTGGQGGVGQSQWDAAAKSNFERRTGKKTRINLAEEIEHRLRETGHLAASSSLPRSNLNRLLSAEAFRNRVGISIVKNRVEFTHDVGKVTSALTRIAHDLISKKVTLEDIWNNAGKRRYLDKLGKEGVLPTVADALPENKDFRRTTPVPKAPDKEAPAKPASPPETRATLIRNIDYGLGHRLINRIQIRAAASLTIAR